MAALATVENVHELDLHNEFVDIADGYIQCLLDRQVVAIIGPVWAECDLQVIGESLVAAHMLTMALNGSDGPAGAVTAESAGGLSRSYAQPGGMNDTVGDWNATTYGRQYLTLRATLPTSPAVLC